MVNWIRRRGVSVVFLVTVFLAAACEGRGPTTPTSPPPPPSTSGGPSPPIESMAFEMTGIVTDDEGTPVPGAKITVWLDYVDLSSALTDESGGYKVNFTGVPGLNKGPAGTEEAVAFALVEASGYEGYARYVLGTSQYLVGNIQLHRIKRITAGESAVLTISPDDTLCATDAAVGDQTICRTVRVVVASNGIMRIEAVPTQAGSKLPMLRVYGGGTGARGNPSLLRAAAGIEYTVDVEVAWGFNGSQSFVVKTSMAGR